MYRQTFSTYTVYFFQNPQRHRITESVPVSTTCSYPIMLIVLLTVYNFIVRMLFKNVY